MFFENCKWYFLMALLRRDFERASVEVKHYVVANVKVPRLLVIIEKRNKIIKVKFQTRNKITLNERRTQYSTI